MPNTALKKSNHPGLSRPADSEYTTYSPSTVKVYNNDQFVKSTDNGVSGSSSNCIEFSAFYGVLPLKGHIMDCTLLSVRPSVCLMPSLKSGKKSCKKSKISTIVDLWVSLRSTIGRMTIRSTFHSIPLLSTFLHPLFPFSLLYQPLEFPQFSPIISSFSASFCSLLSLHHG